MIQILLFNDHLSSHWSTTRVDFRLSVGVPGVQTGISWVPLHGTRHSLLLLISWQRNICLPLPGRVCLKLVLRKRDKCQVFVSILKRALSTCTVTSD